MLTELLTLKPCRTFVQPSVGVHGLDMCAFGPCHFFWHKPISILLDRNLQRPRLWDGYFEAGRSWNWQSQHLVGLSELEGLWEQWSVWMKSGPKSTANLEDPKGNMSKYGQWWLTTLPDFQTNYRLLLVRISSYNSNAEVWQHMANKGIQQFWHVTMAHRSSRKAPASSTQRRRVDQLSIHSETA